MIKNLRSLSLLVSLVGVIAFGHPASAQTLVINDGAATSWTMGSQWFNTDSNGISTLSTSAPNYHADLGTLGLQAGLPNTGGGWVFSNSTGTVVITDNAATPSLALGDPFVSYSYSFFNSTSSTQSFSMQFTSSYALTDFEPSVVRASFGDSLTDGTALGTGVTASPTQTATLSDIVGVSTLSSVNAGVDLTLGTQSIGSGDTLSSSTHTGGFPGSITGPSGSYNTLTVTVSGTYSAGAELAVTGRVDVVPEPATWALLLGGLGSLAFIRRLRSARRL